MIERVEMFRPMASILGLMRRDVFRSWSDEPLVE